MTTLISVLEYKSGCLLLFFSVPARGQLRFIQVSFRRRTKVTKVYCRVQISLF